MDLLLEGDRIVSFENIPVDYDLYSFALRAALNWLLNEDNNIRLGYTLRYDQNSNSFYKSGGGFGTSSMTPLNTSLWVSSYSLDYDSFNYYQSALTPPISIKYIDPLEREWPREFRYSPGDDPNSKRIFTWLNQIQQGKLTNDVYTANPTITVEFTLPVEGQLTESSPHFSIKYKLDQFSIRQLETFLDCSGL